MFMYFIIVFCCLLYIGCLISVCELMNYRYCCFKKGLYERFLVFLINERRSYRDYVKCDQNKFRYTYIFVYFEFFYRIVLGFDKEKIVIDFIMVN